MFRQATLKSKASVKDPITWRGREVSRLEALTDGMFGFAITLLVVSLDAPRNFRELMGLMSGFIPFALCFAMMIWVWAGHNRFFRRFGLNDGWTIVLNSALVFVVLFFVYPLRFVASSFVGYINMLSGGQPPNTLTPADLPTLFTVYGLGFIAVFGLFGLMYVRAYQLREELELTETEEKLVYVEVLRYFGIAGVGVLSIILTVIFKNPMFSGPVYSFIGLVEWWHGVKCEKILKAAGA